MIDKWEEGYEDVYAKRVSRGKESWLRRTLSMRFYKILNKLSKVEMLQNVGDFRLLDKRCVEALKSLRETERYTKGLFCWIGYRKAEVLFDRGDRVAGTTSWSMWKLMRLGIDGIISFTTAPLHLATWLGLLISFFAFVYLKQRNRGLPVADGSGVLLFVVEQFTEVIMRFCRFGQDGNSVIQDQLLHDAAWEAQIRGEGFGFPDTGEGGCGMPLFSLGVGQRIGDHGMRNRTGGEHTAGILPEPEAKELIGGGQVILHAAAGSPGKIISAVFPEEEREI